MPRVEALLAGWPGRVTDRAVRMPAARARDIGEHGIDEAGLGAAVGVEVDARGADQRRADDRGVGGAATAAACSGFLMPKPTATGNRVNRRSRATAVGDLGGVGRAGAGDPGDRDVIDKAAGALDDQPAGARRRWSASPGG